MAEKRSQRGIPLPGLWPTCVVVAAMAGACILWSEFHRIHEPPALGSRKPDPGEKLRSFLDLSRQGESALDELTTLLQSDDRTTRRHALFAVGEMGPDAQPALAVIRDRFADEDAMVRQTALATFSRICNDQGESLAVAAAFLADSETQVRELAARMLQAAGAASIPALIAVAHSENPEARQLVIRLLIEADKDLDAGEVNATLRSLFNDPQELVRLQAIKAALGRGAASVEEVRDWLRDEEPKVVAEGLRAVDSLGPESAGAILPELAALLEQAKGGRSQALFNAISHFKADAAPLIPAILRRVAEGNFGGYIVAQTLVAIGADPKNVVPILIPLISGKDNVQASEAGKLLAQIDPDEARRQVSRLNRDLSARERSITGNDPALAALMGLGSQAQEAVPLLIRLLGNSNDFFVPVMAMQTLGRIGAKAAPAIPILLALVDHEKTGQCIRALVDIGCEPPVLVPKLLKLVDDPNQGEYATEALGKIGDASPEVVAALRRQVINGPTIGGQLSHLPRICVAAIQSLVLLAGDRATTLADLLPLLAASDKSVRAEAISAIGRLSCDRQEAIGPLIETLADDDPTVRTAAALALGRIGPQAKAALPALHSIAADRRNAVAKSSHAWPDEKIRRQISLAEAAQWAITAIESPVP